MSAIQPSSGRAQQWLSRLMPAAAWACYAPLGLKYMAWLLALGLAASCVRHERRWASVWQQPGAAGLLSLFAWLLLSASWSAAPWPVIGTHVWMYGLPLGALLLAAACPPAAALRALGHFVTASACIGTLSVVQGLRGLPVSMLWSSTITAEGNQRIVTSLLLAVGAVLGCWLAVRQANSGRALSWQAAGPLLAVVLAVAGLILQDRRSGMLLLPLLLLAWALSEPLRWRTKVALVLTVMLSALAVWQGSDTVRARFDEGALELRNYAPDDRVTTSWGQRLRMYELSAAMVAERPLSGHGLGSWRQQWQQRVTQATPLAVNTTPHNEYLLLGVQGGVPAMLLLAAWLLTMLVLARQRGVWGTPALLVWLTLALTGLVHAVLRDAKFALPLLLLAALGVALSRQALPSGPVQAG